MAAEQHEAYRKRVGQVLHGKWRLERLIGVGGMAAVYAARHRVGAPVAIKILHPEVARSEQIRKRFEQEAMVMGKLEHPGAIEVRDIDVTEDGAPYMVMELLEGESLKDRLQRLGSIPVEEALRYADEALDVLAAAHDQGIVHRDIKLDNLFITAGGGLKVLDFGIARMREGAALTMVGTRLGTLPYMPPEQVKGQDIDGRADLFAVGAVLFRVLSRRRVHEASTEADMIVKMSALPAPSLRSVAPALSADLCAVIDRALAYQRDKRYPDARSMQADVRAVRSGQAPAVAARLLAELGPPNDLVEPATARPGAAPLAEPETSFTRVGTPPAAQTASKAGTPMVVAAGAGAVSPVSATAAAIPFVVSPAGEPGAPAVGPLSQTAQAPVSASAPLGVSMTAAIPAQLPAALAEPTQLSAGVAQVGAPHTSRLPEAVDGAAGLIEPTAVSRTGAMVGVVAAATSPGPVSLGAPPASLGAPSASLGAPPVSLGAPPVSVSVAAEEDRRRKRVAVGIILATGALALFLVLALWLVFSGEESAEESEEDGDRDRSAQAGDDDDDAAERAPGPDAGASGTKGTIKLPARTFPTTTVARPVATQGKTPTSSPPTTTTQVPTGTPPAIVGDDDDDDGHDHKSKGNKSKKKNK